MPTKCHWRVVTSETDYYGGKTRAAAVKLQQEILERKGVRGRLDKHCSASGLGAMDTRKHSTEVERMEMLTQRVCYPSRENCPDARMKACKALQRLMGRLKRRQPTDKNKDDVREAMYHLDRCRKRSGERLSLYGLKKEKRHG